MITTTINFIARTAATVDAPAPNGSISPIMWPVMAAVILLFWALNRAGRNKRERDRFLADVIAEYERIIHEYDLTAQAAGRPPYQVSAAAAGGPDDTAWQLAIGNVVKGWDSAAVVGQQVRKAERRSYSSGFGAGWYLGSR